MHANLLTAQARFFEDQSLVLVAFGGFGRYVLHLLRQEFGRLQVPDDRLFFLAFDTDRTHRDDVDAHEESDDLVHLEPFQADVYLANRENDTLRQAVSHLPETALRQVADGCKGLPGVGLVALHRYDDTLVTNRMRNLIDEARAKNPGGKVKCILVSGMGGGTSNGMSVPFLFRVRDHLKNKKVRLEVFLATSEGHLGLQNASEEKIERNCVASAMLWEQVMLGDRDIVYPGKEGVREDRAGRGPLQQRTWVFSGGAGNTTYQYPVVASIMANCIAALELTRLGSYLDGDRVNYAEDLLERVWVGPRGGRHPTALLAMNTAGLKADSFPALFHLRAVRSWIDEVTRSLAPAAETRVRERAEACVREARLEDEPIIEDLRIGAHPVTREEIAAAKPPQERLHGWLSARLEEDVGTLIRLAQGTEESRPTEELVERARQAIRGRAAALASGPDGWLPGAILFYQTVQKRLEANRQAVQERARFARQELGAMPNRERLDHLLDRLRRDTVPDDGHHLNVVERFVATLTVSVPTQVRKILEVAAEIRGHAQLLAASAVLTQVYERLAHFCEKQREELQGRLYVLNNTASRCMREEELMQRAARGAFTFQRARFEPLVGHLWDALRERMALPSAEEVVGHLGGDLPAFLASEPHPIDRLLQVLRPDAAVLAAAADEVLAADEVARDVLKESLAQFFPTIQVDRDRFPTLETARARFVLCTRRMYEAHAEDIFEGYHHLETDNPYNVLFTEHEEGIPFIALSYMQRINEAYKALDPARAALGHPTADLARTLPLLDA
jgi:hypothetical protein